MALSRSRDMYAHRSCLDDAKRSHLDICTRVRVRNLDQRSTSTQHAGAQGVRSRVDEKEPLHRWFCAAPEAEGCG